MSNRQKDRGAVTVDSLTLMFEIQKRLGNGSLKEDSVNTELQAIIEKRPLDLSSFSSKVIEVHDGVEISELFLAQRMNHMGQALKRHRNGGGWVPVDQDESDQTMPFIAESAFVGPLAMVFENARVYDNARVYHGARVYGNAQVYGDALVYGQALVFDNAEIFDNAEVYNNGSVCGCGQVSGNARVMGYILIGGQTRVSGKTVLNGKRAYTGGNQLNH